jgi:hypothetical protein
VLFIKDVTRKCQQCGKKIDVEASTDFIIYKDKYYHKSCFIENRINLKKGKWTVEECNQEIEKLIPLTEKHLMPIINKHKLYQLIADNYNISAFSTLFCLKIENIINGTYKNVTKPIPAEDLIDMWQQKMSYLNKVSVNNQKNGKQMEGLSRANYDLAILLSRYDKYLAWKERKRIEQEQIEKESENKNSQIDYAKINLQSNSHNTKTANNKIDINEILDEI